MKQMILVTYGKKLVQSYDMGGFPDERLATDKSKVVVITDITKEDMEFAFDFGLLPSSKTRVMAHPELTEQQVMRALVNHMDEKLSK